MKQYLYNLLPHMKVGTYLECQSFLLFTVSSKTREHSEQSELKNHH